METRWSNPQKRIEELVNVLKELDDIFRFNSPLTRSDYSYIRERISRALDQHIDEGGSK
jgi:hypothetical protein